MESYPMFPLFISLAGKRAVVVGGGQISARRVEKLRTFGAKITVISPALHSRLLQDVDAGTVHWEKRAYRTGDLAGTDLALAATDSRAVNHAVAQEAQAANIPVSVADCHEESSFYFPAVMRGGGLVAGMVSEDGATHHAVREMAVKIREILNGKENNPGGQPGKSSGGHTVQDRDGGHPKGEPRP